MGEFNCYATGKVKMNKKDLFSLYASTLHIVGKDKMDVSFEVYPSINEDIFIFTVKHYNSDSFKYIVGCIHYYGNILEFYGNIADIENDEDEWKYKIENGQFYECCANTQNVYEEFGNYTQFKEIISQREEFDFFESSINGLLFKHIKNAAAKSEDEKTFLENLQLEVGSKINFKDPNLDIEMSILQQELEYEDNTKLWICNDEEGTLCFGIDSIYKQFKEYDETNEFESIITYELKPKEEEPKLEIKIKCYLGKELTGLVPFSTACNLFLIEAAQVRHRNEWHEIACDTCENGLRKQIKGCHFCDFQPI